uniref:Uncharacterized protein n=1 Tax=Anguilla anguilla TaxID=7936 RepID=A0A0E9VH10_ANGAN
MLDIVENIQYADKNTDKITPKITLTTIL